MAFGVEEDGTQPFQTTDADGDELAVPVCSFSSDSSAEEDGGGRVCCEIEENPHARYAQSLSKLYFVQRHQHRDRDLASLDPQVLRPPGDLDDGDLPRIDVEHMSLAQFAAEFSAACRPAMILGVAKEWRASERWSSRESMLEHYGHVPFKVTEIFPPYGGARPLKVELPLSLYVEYVEEVAADFPFYVFERDLEGPRSELLNDFCTPAYFLDDLYDLTEYTRAFFPMYKYVIIGVDRTGSSLHVDPSCTSAWNTLLCGLKRWVLFPPNDSPEFKERIGAVSTGMGGAAPPAYWWLDTLPNLKTSGAGKELGMIECLQRPGETIFVPHGWWHCVLNIGFTAAVTQNFVRPESLPKIWDKLVADWPDFSRHFEVLLRELRPDVKVPSSLHGVAA